jgi:hypothetical protein
MYTDPRVTYEFLNVAGAVVEVEATADILTKVGRVVDVATGTDAVIDAVLCPAGGSIEAFGVEVTETLTNANATKCIVAVKALDKPGGTATTVASITLPGAAAEIVAANTRASDGTPTAAQCVAVGARILSSATALPYKVGQGGLVYCEVTQAAGAAGGSFKAFVVIRQNGQPDPGPAATSPVTLIAA